MKQELPKTKFYTTSNTVFDKTVKQNTQFT